MGLDMYLKGHKYLWGFDNKRPQEDGFEVEAKTLMLGYWRKHPDLHGYIVLPDAFTGADESRSVIYQASW